MPRRFGAVLVVALAVVALVALVVSLAREGPDQTSTGRVTRVEPHRLCIGRAGGADLCAHVDSPASVAALEVGDCVELERSPEEILESVRASTGC